MTPIPPDLPRRKLLATGALASLAALGGSLSACDAGSMGIGSATGPAEGALRLLTPIFDGTDGKQILESQLLPRFRAKYPKVTVSVDYTTYEKLDAKVTTGLAGGAPPDVMIMGAGWIDPFAARKVLRDLTPAGGQASLNSTYAPGILDACQHDGKLYALPVMLDCRIGIYRKDLLAQAGLTRPPGSLAELRQYAIELTQRGGGRLTRSGLDFQSLDVRQMFESVLFSFGGTLFTGGQPSFNNATGVAALQWLVDLQRKDKVIDAGFSSSTAASLPLADGRAAMAIGHNNWWITVGKTRPEIKAQLVPFLLNPEKPSMFTGGSLVTVSATSRYTPAALALAKFLSGSDVSLAASQQRGNVPAFTSTLNSPYVKENELVKFALTNLKHARYEGGLTAWLRIRSEFKGAIQSALLGRQTSKQALDGLAAIAKTAIAETGRK